MNNQSPLYLEIPFPDLARFLAQRVANEWRAFCELPAEVKSAFSIGVEDPACDDGYRMRCNAGEDPKEFFHVTRANLPDLCERIGRFDQRRAGVSAMLALADALLIEASDMVYDYAERIAKTVPGCEHLTREIFASGHIATLRFLHYLPGKCAAGEILAAPHIDQGGPTLHLYESESGLEYLDRDDAWKELPIGKGTEKTTPCFGGLTQQYATSSSITALCHRVIATERTGKEGRWSIVCFSEILSAPRVRKDLRLSQLTPGFNYDLDKLQLKPLFG